MLEVIAPWWRRLVANNAIFGWLASKDVAGYVLVRTILRSVTFGSRCNIVAYVNALPDKATGQPAARILPVSFRSCLLTLPHAFRHLFWRISKKYDFFCGYTGDHIKKDKQGIYGKVAGPAIFPNHWRYVREPWEIPGISSKLLAGAFSRLDDRLDEAIAGLGPVGSATEADEALREFYKWSRQHIDCNAYAEIQNECLQPDRLRSRFHRKYLNFLFWTAQKIELALSLDLKSSAPRRVLDIGSGAGHFALVAKSMRHDVTALDVPAEFAGHEYYDRLTALFGINRRVLHVINAGERLPAFPARFDIAVALKTQFNLLEDRAWGADEWHFFITDLQENVMEPDGFLLMQIPEGKTSTDGSAYLSSIAEHLDPDSRTMRIRFPIS